ncbi:MAG: IS110 family transposase [Candidatus Izemoplasmatales bacterium]|nr:IS110 family transposase [Candidatus Izemoplasmatales bacterium]
MYLIGIDISKYKHDCFIATETGEVIKDVFSFDNNQKGFTILLNILEALDPIHEKRIGLEATGHYGYNLKAFLDQHDYTFMELNPFLVSKFATSLSLRKTKTDKADSKLLSMILLSVEYKIYPVKSYHIQDLKTLTRFYRYLVKSRSKETVNITNILDYMFPEFKPFFSNVFSTTALFILSEYKTPTKIARMNKQSYHRIRSISRGRFSYAKFIKLKDLAKNTIGSSSALLQLQLQSVLNVYKSLTQEINNLKHQLLLEASEINSPVFSIKGVSIISGLSIIAEYGNFISFKNPSQLLSFAGLEPSVIQSGTMNKTGRMVKRGSPYLRETIMNVSMYFTIHNPTIYDYYNKKRSEGKAHRVALTHVAKKLLRIIFHLTKSNQEFDQTKLK